MSPTEKPNRRCAAGGACLAQTLPVRIAFEAEHPAAAGRLPVTADLPPPMKLAPVRSGPKPKAAAALPGRPCWLHRGPDYPTAADVGADIATRPRVGHLRYRRLGDHPRCYIGSKRRDRCCYDQHRAGKESFVPGEIPRALCGEKWQRRG